MGTSSSFLCILFLCGALGLSTPPPPARSRLRCYTCSFAKPCYPVPTKCQDDEACGISIGTSEQNEIIERKGCLPRSQCLLQGRATFWSRSYALRHHCCEQDLCNTAAALQLLPSPLLAALLLLSAGFTWGGPLLRWLQADLPPSSPPSRPLHPRYAQGPGSVETLDSQPHAFPDPFPGPVFAGTALAPIDTCPEPRLINNTCSRSSVFSRCPRLMHCLSSRSWARQAVWWTWGSQARGLKGRQVWRGGQPH